MRLITNYINIAGVCDCCDGSDEWNVGSKCRNSCSESVRNTDIVLMENSKRKLSMEAKKIVDPQGFLHLYLNKEGLSHGSVNILIHTANLRGQSSIGRKYHDHDSHFSIFYASRATALIILSFVLVLYILYTLFQ